VGLALKDGQLPGQLKVGDHVGIYAVSGQSSGSAGCPGSGGAVLTGNAVVINVVTSGSGSLVSGATNGATDVTVAVSPADAGAVACDAAAGNVAVAVLPAGGTAAGPRARPAPSNSLAPSPAPTGTG